MNAKSAAPVITSLYKPKTPAQTPEEVKKERENQLIVLRLMHRYEPKALQELFASMSKTDPDTAAEIISDFYATSSEDLYGIKPTPAGATTEVSIAPSEANPPTLPPPQPMTAP